MRRAQITVFIIIGIVVLAAALGAAYFISRGVQKVPAEQVPVNTQPIDLYVKSCLQSTAEDGIYILGIQGGYIVPENPYAQTEYGDIAYSYYNGSKTFPTRQIVELQLAGYVETYLNDCLNNFTELKQQYNSIDAGEPKASVQISNDNVAVSLEYLLKISTADKQVSIKDFSAKVPIRLGYILLVAESMTDKTIEDPTSISTDLLTNFDLTIDILPNEDNAVFKITDYKSLYQNNPYVFMFAENFGNDTAPEIILDDEFNVTLESGFYKKIDVISSRNLTFYTDSSLFDAENGIIDFYAALPGIYDVTITAVDDLGRSSDKFVRFNIG